MMVVMVLTMVVVVGIVSGGGNDCGGDGDGDFLWFMISFIKSDYFLKIYLYQPTKAFSNN